MSRVIKPAFNGGRIGPSLHWRSDLQLHSSSCKELLNWIPEISGSITRRPGARNLLSIVPEVAIPDPFSARHFDFQYGQTGFDTVILHSSTDGVFSPILEDGLVEIGIYNQNGSRVVLFTAPDVPYLVKDLDSLTFQQSYDVLLIFSDSHPTMRITRTSETEWSLAPHEYLGGPWKLGNVDKTKIVTAAVAAWDVGTSYVTGDTVITGTDYSLTGSSINTLYSVVRETLPGQPYQQVYYYHSRIYFSASPVGLQTGDKVTISGSIPNAPKEGLDGDWTIASVDLANKNADLVTGTLLAPGVSLPLTPYWKNDHEGTVLTSAKLVGKGQRQTFHVAQRDNTGVDPSIQPSSDWTSSNFLNGQLVLTATDEVWSSEDVGRNFRVVSDQVPRVSGTFGTTDQGKSSEIMPVSGLITLTTESGIWSGELVLQLSLDGGGSWDDIGEISSQDGNRNGTVTRTITDFGALVRAYMRTRTAATSDSGCKYYITVSDPQYCYFKILSYTSPTAVVVELQNSIGSIPSSWRWNESAFGGAEGYPSNAVILNDTLIVSGVPGSPGAVYFSTTGDWTNWVTGGYAGAAFDLSVGGDSRNVVQWMKSKESLLIGTDAGEWSVYPRDTESTLSLLNYKVERQAEYGSENVPALTMGDVVVYVERGNFRLRALESSVYDNNSFQSIDISFKVPDFFSGKVVRQIAYSRSPIPTLWVLLDDRLYSWVFDTTNSVSAWSEHYVAGAAKVLSISTTPSTAGDVLLMVVSMGPGTAVLQGVQLGNDHLDGLEVYTSANAYTVYPYRGVQDNPKVYDAAYIEAPDAVFVSSISTVHPSPRFLRTLVPSPNLRISFDGRLGEERIDYVTINGTNALTYFLFTDGVISAATGVSPLLPDVDYFISEGSNSTHLSLTPDVVGDLGWGDLAIETITPPATLAVGEYIVQSDNTVVVPGHTFDNLQVTSTGGTVILTRGFEYLSNPINNGFAMLNVERPGRVIAGYSQDNLVWPVDIMADMQQGGPGGTVILNQVDVLVKESLGLQVRGYHGWVDPDDEEEWMSIPDVTPTSIVGGTLPLYTGVQRVDFSSDIEYNGVDIQLRAIGPRHSTICSLAVDTKRIK